MTYLTSQQAKTCKQTLRYYVELVSYECDFEGCPLKHHILDLVVVSRKEIPCLIAACRWLDGYRVMSVWQPEIGDAPF